MAIEFNNLQGMVKTANYNGNNITKIVQDGQTIWKQHFDVTYVGPALITPVLTRSYSEDPYLNRFTNIYPEDNICIDDTITGINFMKNSTNLMITNYTFNGVKPSFNYYPTGDLEVVVTASTFSGPTITNYTSSVGGGTVGSITFQNTNNVTVRASVWAKNSNTGIGYDITNSGNGGEILLAANASSTQYLILDSGTWNIIVTFTYVDKTGETYQSSNSVSVTSTNSDPVLPSPSYLESPTIVSLKYEAEGNYYGSVTTNLNYCTLKIQVYSREKNTTKTFEYIIGGPGDPLIRNIGGSFSTASVTDTITLTAWVENNYLSSLKVTRNATKEISSTYVYEQIFSYESLGKSKKSAYIGLPLLVALSETAGGIQGPVNKVEVTFNTREGTRTGTFYEGHSYEAQSEPDLDEIGWQGEYIASTEDNYIVVSPELELTWPSYGNYISFPKWWFEFSEGKKTRIDAKVRITYNGPEPVTDVTYETFLPKPSSGAGDPSVSFNLRDLSTFGDCQSYSFFKGYESNDCFGDSSSYDLISCKITVSVRDKNWGGQTRFSFHTSKPNGDADPGLVEGLYFSGYKYLSGDETWEMELLTPYRSNLIIGHNHSVFNFTGYNIDIKVEETYFGRDAE